MGDFIDLECLVRNRKLTISEEEKRIRDQLFLETVMEVHQNLRKEKSMFSWKILIENCMKDYNETLDDIISITITDEELNQPFDVGYGTAEGVPFTAWTENRVYFPVVYDGSEWVSSVPRNPNGESTQHIGAF